VGILGRLGDLATIPEKYDVAVSTACGSLDHIVVQTTAGVQKCIEFLRKYNLGRANFIPLDKMKKGAHDNAVETPEGAPRLFDLITPINFSVTPAVYLGVGNTLVAPDLETATRWAFDFGKRWRVVTLDGNLIESSGTMQGGGNSVRKGLMRFTNSVGPSVQACDGTEEEAETLQAQATMALDDLKNCRAQRRSIAEEIRNLNKRVKTLSVQIPKLTMEIESCDTTREELNKRLPELRKQCVLSDEDAAKLVELNKKVQKCKTDMASCSMLASKLEADVARLQKSILDAGGSRLKKQQEICEQTVSDLNASTKKLNSARVMITSSQKTLEKAKAAREQAEKELEECKDSLQQKKDQFKKLEEEALGVMQAYDTVQELYNAKKVALKEAIEESDELKKTLSKVKGYEIELLGKMENCEKLIQDNMKKVEYWDEALEKLLTTEMESDDFGDESDEEDDAEEDRCNVTEDNQEKENNLEDMEMNDVDDKITEVAAKPRKEKRALPIYSAQQLEQYRKDEVKDQLSTLESERESMAKDANMTAIAEYRKKEEDYLAK
jgi:structural maintenance of chromosome 4